MKKNKKIFTAAIAAAAAAALSCNAYAQTKTVDLQVGNAEMRINGESFELDSPPVIADGRTLVPIRAIVEALDGEVDWDNASKTAVLTSSTGDVVKLTVNSKTAYFNETSAQLDTAPVIINGRTMLPIRFVAESFGYTTDWNAADKSIVISNGGETAKESTVDLSGYTEGISASDADGNIYCDMIGSGDSCLLIKDKDGNAIAVYKAIDGNNEIYKDKKGNTLVCSYVLGKDNSIELTISVNGGERTAKQDDNYNTVDEAGNVYEFEGEGTISVKDKSGKVIEEYETTNELQYPYVADNGSTVYKVLRRGGGYEDGFIYADGKYVPFENNYDWSYMGSDGRIYNTKYEYIIVTDSSYKKLEEWTAVPNGVDVVYIGNDKTEYVLTGEMAETYVLTAADKKITLTCDPEEEHNKKLLAGGSYGTDDAIYYNGDDKNVYVGKDNVFTVYVPIWQNKFFP